MTASKFMLGGPKANPVEVINILDAAYRSVGYLTLGIDHVGLEDTVGEAKSIDGLQDGVRVFRVTVEEVQ